MPLGRIQGTVSKERMPIDIGQWQPAKRMPLGSIQGAVSKETMPLDIGDGLAGNDAVRHQTMVASHTETPLGVSKWLV